MRKAPNVPELFQEEESVNGSDYVEFISKLPLVSSVSFAQLLSVAEVILEGRRIKH